MVGFFHFEGVDTMRVLVDEFHHILEEVLEAFTFEVETDQGALVVSLGLEHLF